jgi:ABC-type glycerol-3-phosphate transport system substrate-binding protein
VTVPFEMPVVVTLAGYFDDQTLALLDDLVARFEAANPDILVEVITAERDASARREAWAGYLAAGDSSRDIYVISSHWLAELAAGDGLLALDSYLPAPGLARDDLLAAAIEAATIDGRLMALPWTVDGGLLYYRRDLLVRHGHQPPATWPALAGMARDVLAAQPDLPQGYVWQGAAYEGLTCNTLEFVWAFGGTVLDEEGEAAFDNPETRAALAEMQHLLDGGISPPEVAGYREAASLGAFQNGQTLFMRNWSYAWDRLNASGAPLAGQVGIAPLPASCLGGQSLALSASSLHPAQAFRFMAYLAGHEQQARLALDGVQPPARATVYGDEAVLAEDPALADIYSALATARPRPRSARYGAISQVLYTQVNAMLRGEQDPAATAASIQAGLEEVLP